MAPETEKDELAGECFNNLLQKLRFGQDYYIYPGSSEPMLNEKGEQNGISIKRADVRLYSTGVTKLYEMVVEDKEMPDVVYTEAEEKQFDDEMKKRFPEVFTDDDPSSEPIN